MGRKKSYSKKQQNAGRATNGAEVDGDDEGDESPDPSNTVIVTTAELAEEATSTVAALTGGTQAPTTEVTGTPPGAALRGEWAQVAPARLEAAEEESFWFAFALAVMACSPPMLSIPAALVASGLAARILRALWSVPVEVAPDDLGSARTMFFMTVVFAVVFKATQGGGMMGMIWIMMTVFFFNALRNVRTMVGLALSGGPKKKKKSKEIEGSK